MGKALFADAVSTFRHKEVKARSVDELIGICKGVISDGVVCQKEAEFLLNWMESNTHAADEFPACVLYPRLAEMLRDGNLDSEEAQGLLDTLQKMTGEQGQQATVVMSTSLAYDDPVPSLDFAGQSFCFTGDFAYGFRSDVQKRTSGLGGLVIERVAKKGCVLVVGCMGSDNWLHSTHGRKIREAVAARDDGKPVVVVSEEHWNACCETKEACCG